MGTQQGHTGGPPATPAGTALAGARSVAAGTPTDQNVPQAIDGAIHVDTSGNKIWVRINGTWKSVAVS